MNTTHTIEKKIRVDVPKIAFLGGLLQLFLSTYQRWSITVVAITICPTEHTDLVCSEQKKKSLEKSLQ